jgi:hypothetical protein
MFYIYSTEQTIADPSLETIELSIRPERLSCGTTVISHLRFDMFATTLQSIRFISGKFFSVSILRLASIAFALASDKGVLTTYLERNPPYSGRL